MAIKPGADVRRNYLNAAAQLLKNLAPVHTGKERQGIVAAADLITCAPDLLEACRQMAWALYEIQNGGGLIAGHGDALAKGMEVYYLAVGEKIGWRQPEAAKGGKAC